MSPTAELTIERLDAARQRWWVFSMLSGLVMAVTASLAMLAMAVFTDVLLQLPLVWLRLLLIIWGCLSAVLLGSMVYRLLTHSRSLTAAARRVEIAFPELGSHLINLLQLATAPDQPADPFRQAAIAEAAAHVQHVPLYQAADRHTRWSRWRLGLQTPRDLAEASAALVVVLGLVAVLGMIVPEWSSSVTRLFTPWRFVPQVGTVEILEVTPGDTEVLLGTPLTITARIDRPKDRQVEATLFVTADGNPQPPRPMVANTDHDRFTLTLPAVVAALDYRLEIGDSQSDIYHVAVRQIPTVDRVGITYVYPAYLGREPSTVEQQHGDLEAPQYTKAHLTFHCSTPIARGYVQLPDGKIHGRVDADGRSLQLDLPLAEETHYTTHVLDDREFANAEPRVQSIHVIPDAAPTVQLVKPATELTIAPGDPLPLAVRAGDDHGLTEVRLEWKVVAPDDGDAAPPVATIRRWSALSGATATTLSYRWSVDSAHARPGQTLLVRAVAVDTRRLTWRGNQLDPQTAASPWRTIHLIDPARAAAAAQARVEGLHAQLWSLLQTQIATRITTAQLRKAARRADLQRPVQSVRERQVRIQITSARLAASIEPRPDTHAGTVKRALNQLARDPMLRAARQAESIADMQQLSDLQEATTPLMALQDQIIDQLRRLLATSRRASAESLAELPDRRGGDLPDDAQEKLRELAKKLNEFAKQQRKVIEATENLAKRPVDDFSDADAKALEQLAAIEDDWSRFMAETFSDFSKLPEQDFANPSLLEEMVEIQTELKMAADALTKKSVDIAVPLEQLGAEMAEELVTNIEKWLPDTPDRERWSQEEPLDDAMKEAPMAELPGELEDLIGELMEDEEALFDEMDDVSSSWADSLDKGAGWDAADGPISNMSAKGVTGNRLPNTSEIGGRSGEGRQGKASGEFVGDTAVGKGGRKTPSRLAPDPVVKGQVRDLSKDPVGGATGGGKESGAGGEGLEGPTPHQAGPDLKRMANRQADLRNRAETIDLKFQVLNYHHTDLKKLIDMMASVERDLRSGRYQSAQRRRDEVLGGLRNIKTYLEGEFEIRRDQTSNLPSDIQRQLLGTMQEASPAGWEQLNRHYFDRLSGADPTPSANDGIDPRE